MVRYDMHSHSSRSDGTLAPAEIVALAKERGLDGLAITDHDTFAGLDEAAGTAESAGLWFVPGIEFSAEYEGASLHILAYWVDPADTAIREELSRLVDSRPGRLYRGSALSLSPDSPS